MANLLEILQEIADREKFTLQSVEIKHRVNKGDSYLGIVKLVTLKSPHRNKRLELILKVAPSNAAVRQETASHEAFVNEVLFYGQIWTVYQQYIANTPCYNPIPVCFASGAEDLNEFLILENLKAHKYIVHNPQVPFDWNHTVLVLQEYAKLHALGLCYKQNQPKAFNELDLRDIFYQFFNTPEKVRVTNIINEELGDYIEDHFKDPKVTAKFRACLQKMVPFFSEIKNWDSSQKSTVLLHGDCWCNNILFKYPKIKNVMLNLIHLEPLSVKLIDFQVIKRGPSAIDLAHFLYLCASKSVYDNLEALLYIYYRSLYAFGLAIGVEPENIITFDELRKDWKLYGRYGLYMATVQMKLSHQDAKKTPAKFDDATDGTANVAMGAFRFIPSSNKFRKRFTDLVQHLYERDFLN